MNAKQIRDAIAALATKNADILAKSRNGQELTDEEHQRATEAGKELRQLRDDLVIAEARETDLADLAAANDHYNKPGSTPARAVPGQQSRALGDGREPAQAPEYRTIGEAFVQSDEFKRGLKRGGLMRGDGFHLRSLDRTRLVANDGEVIDRRALVTSATPPASYLQPTYVPGIFTPDEAEFTIRSVLLNGQTQSDTITYMRELVFTNNAAFVAEATAVNGTGAAGGVKPESGITFEEATAPIRTLAHWLPVTRQTMEDTPAMVSLIEQRLLTGLERVENAALLNGSGTAPEITGILNTSGIQAYDATYFTANPVQDAAATNGDLNRLRRAITSIRITGRATATFIALSPADLERVDTISDANRNYLISGPLQAARRTLWGLPVIEAEGLPTGTALVGDGTMAMVWDRMDSQIYTTDSHADFFIRNIFVILAEKRMGLSVFRPKAFNKVTLSTAS